MSALVFVTTGAGGREQEFWWDELEQVFLQPDELAQQLVIGIAGSRRSWDLSADRVYTAEQQERHRGWHLLDEHFPTVRHAVFRKVYELVQPLAIDARTRTLDELLALAGRDGGAVRASRRAMEPGQVARMVEEGVMDVGAHTVNHPVLPVQHPDVQRTELSRSKRDLEWWVGRAVAGFAYPYGLHDDVAVAAVRQAGFEFACTSSYRPADPSTEPFRMPRIEAPAVDGDALGRILRWQLQ